MAGERALVSSAGGQGLLGTSRANLDMGSVTYDPDSILTESSAGVYRPDEAGQYLIVASGQFTSTHDNRQNIKWIGSRNGTDVSGFVGSNYSRHNEADILIVQCYAILPFNGTTDYFEIDDIRDAGGGTPAGDYDWTYLKVIRLSDGATELPYGRYGTPASAAHSGQDVWSDITGWDVESETDTAVIADQDGTNIRFKEADRPYLLVYGLANSDSGAGRTTRLARVLHNSTLVAHSYGYTYQRNSADQWGVLTGMALIRPSTANQDINFEMAGYEDVNGVFWGVFDIGSWTLSSAANAAGFMVIALPDSTNIAVFEDLTAGQNTQDAGPDVINHSRSTVGTADSPFTRQSNTDVDVTSAVDVLAVGTLAFERVTSSGERGAHGLRWEVEGVDDATSQGWTYERGDQNSDDCKNAATNCVYVGSPSANDTFQMERYRIGASENGTNTDSMYAGSFFIDLDSLAASGTDDTAVLTTLAVTATFDAVTAVGEVNAQANPEQPLFPATFPAVTAVGEVNASTSLTTLTVSSTFPADTNPV